MKNLRRILYFALAGALLFLASCSGNSEKDSDSPGNKAGRYVEKDITPPIDGGFVSFLDQDGKIVCYGAGLGTRYESADGGENWNEVPGPGRNTDRYSDVRSGTLLPDGSLLAYIQGEGLEKIYPDGGSEHFPVSEIDNAVAEGNNVMISLMQALGGDRLLINYNVGGGMTIQDGRPIGGRPVGGPDAQGEGPVTQGEGPATQGEGPVMQAEAPQGGVPVVQGDDQVVRGPGPATQGSGAPYQGSGPQRGNTSSGSTPMSVGPMTRKTALYELSSGKLIVELPAENAAAAADDGETIYLMDGGGTVKGYKLTDGSPSSGPTINLGGGSNSRGSIGMMPMLGAAGSVLTVNGDSDLYAMYDGNMLLCDKRGDVSTLLEGTAYSIGAPSSSATTVLALGDGSIVVNLSSYMQSNQSNRLYKYAWDENATINPEKTLSVWSLEDNSFVRAAIAELRKKNPDSYITYEVATSGDNAVSKSDAIKTLNTQMLNGSGPDVIILDDCPAESYADKGMLLEISSLVDTGDMYQNLLAPYASGGKTYFLPTQFTMPALLGSPDALDKARTLEDLVSLVVNGNDTSAFSPSKASGPFSSVPEDERAELYCEDLNELCNIMWLSAAPAIVVDNRLDTDALRRCLEAIKAISDKYELAAPDTDSGGRMGMSIAFVGGGRASALPGS
ncbi:MAG: extracellular solute-binding protein, partial [Oscillospiraceae bacterium]|nr:extracellular solute-binding protein [Oscillospiraceae bacterium]